MKKLLSFLLALCLLVSVGCAFAEDTEAEPEFDIFVNGFDVEADNDNGGQPEETVPEATNPEEDITEDELPGGSSGDEAAPDDDITEEDHSEGDTTDSVDEEVGKDADKDADVIDGESDTDSEPGNADDDEDVESGDDAEENADEENIGTDNSADDETKITDDDADDEPDDETRDDEDADAESDAEDENEIMPLMIFQELPPYLADVVVSTTDYVADVMIVGDNLANEPIRVKIVPVGDEKNIAYMRQIRAESYGGCMFSADLSGCDSQLFKITVDAGRAGRIEKLFVCGETNKLTCTRGAMDISVSGIADVKAVQNVTVKITDTSGVPVYVRQIRSKSNGAYSVNATFEDINSDTEYIVHVTEGKTGRQFVKRAGVVTPDRYIYYKECVISGNTGDYGEVVLYGKNITHSYEYTFELTFDPTKVRVKNANIVGSTVKILSYSEGRLVFKSSISNTNVWSGTLNAVQFQLLDKRASVILRAYGESDDIVIEL